MNASVWKEGQKDDSDNYQLRIQNGFETGITTVVLSAVTSYNTLDTMEDEILFSRGYC